MTASQLRSGELARITRLLRGVDLLLVHGPDAQEAIDLAGAALPSRSRLRTGTVDVDLCGSSEELAWRILRASADALAGDERLLDIPDDRRSPAEHKRWLAVRRALGRDFQMLQEPAGKQSAKRDPTTLVSRAVAALARDGGSASGRRILVLRGADSLINVPRTRFTETGRLLWSMRSAAQGARGLVLILTGGPAAIELVSAHDAAFRGWGRSFELQRLGEAELGTALSEERGLTLAVARRIADLSEGLPRLADRLAARAEHEMSASPAADPAEAAWAGLLEAERSALRVTTRLVGDLHRVALPVCRALAKGQAPYSVARSTEVTRALRVLYIRGLCESPAPRTWRLTDPLLAAWLRTNDTTAGRQ